MTNSTVLFFLFVFICLNKSSNIDENISLFCDSSLVIVTNFTVLFFIISLFILILTIMAKAYFIEEDDTSRFSVCVPVPQCLIRIL